ncbi:glycosyltransferase [Neobacillus drentensis]|uniref:glycosyltransferase n=1 Tax=Neobacillus drentensis TaxID=220684 RepID=UPI0030008D79
MKVLIINSVCGIGSTGRIATDLFHTLREEGHDCKIAYGIGTANNVSPEFTIKMNNKYGYYTHNALSRITDKAGFYSSRATRNLIKQIEEYDPDIIHLHNLHGYYINVNILFDYLSKANKPVIWTMHDCWPITGHCTHFDLINCSKWKDGCFNCPQKSEYPKSYFLDKSKENYALKKELFTSVKNMTIITPSNWLTEIIRKSYLGNYTVRTIHNGIDLNVFKPTESSFKEKNMLIGMKIVLGVANAWNSRKGLNDFIRLSEMLDENYKIVLIGLTKEQIAALPKNILGIERTNSIQELAEIYSDADVFVNPTYEDNFPTVNIEALACATPVITYRTGGSPEAIDSNCGQVIDVGDVNKLCEAICTLPSYDPNLILVRASQFERTKKYKEYIDYYMEITQNKSIYVD